MRLAGLALSAALLSGCSYAGGVPSFGNLFSGAQSGSYGGPSATERCRIPYRQAPLPRGCHPSQVTVGTPHGATGPAGAYGRHAGGFPQTPQFGQPSYSKPQYATGNYGSHASGNAHTALHRGATPAKSSRPRFRGSLDLGVETGVSGDILNNAKFPTTPFAAYDPSAFDEARSEGSVAEGQTDDHRYYVNSRLQNTPDPWDTLSAPDISFADAWSAPTSIGIGGEYILSDKTTIFARAAYTTSEGTSGGATTIEGTAFKETTSRFYDDDGILTDISVGTEFITEVPVTEISYDFSDLNRLDLEAGARFYTNPIAGQGTGRTVTPFFGASGGMSRYNAVHYTLDQRQLSYTSVFEEDERAYYDLDVPGGFDVDNNAATPGVSRVDLYDSQWVLSGGLQAGLEWQVTPGTALALETGLRVQGARDYSNGAKGDSRISVPLTLRGSFNF
jgi:hypothetical protein